METDLKKLVEQINSGVQMVRISAQDCDKRIAVYTKEQEKVMMPNVLGDRNKVTRHDAVEERRADFEETAAMVKSVEDNADYWLREGHLRRAATLPPAKLPTGISPGDAAVIDAVNQNTEETRRARLQKEIAAASDRQITEHWLPELARDQSPGIGGLLLADANRRGGVISATIRGAVSKIPLPDADQDAELLEIIRTMGQSLESAWHRLNTGKDDTHALALAASQRYRDHEAKKA